MSAGMSAEGTSVRASACSRFAAAVSEREREERGWTGVDEVEEKSLFASEWAVPDVEEEEEEVEKE